jgi:hypothetical protein
VVGIDVLLQHLNIFITDGKGFMIGLLLNKFFPLSLYNFTICFGIKSFFTYFLFSLDFHLRNNLSILINITFFTTFSASAGNLIFFLHIAPNLILYGRRHLPPIYDGDWDIVSNLKSRSTFECFPCFRGFRWEPIRIKFYHIDNAGRYLIAASLPLFSFVIGDNHMFYHRWTGLFRLGAEVTSYLGLRAYKLNKEI